MTTCRSLMRFLLARMSMIRPALRGDAIARRARFERPQLATEVRRDRTHAGDAGLALGVAVVVRVRVDVVRVELTAHVGDELDAGDPDSVGFEEAAVARDDRMIEVAQDAE